MSMVCSSLTVSESHNLNQDSFEVRVAAGFDDMMMAYAVRAAVFMAEQSCPYDEEFDGNDGAATHVIGLVDGEPAATMRVRYFGDFAKLERMAVRREFRSSPIGAKVIDWTVDFVRRKGFTKLYGHAQDGRERFWQFSMRRHGRAAPIPGVGRFDFSGHAFTAMGLIMEPAPDSLRMDTDPNILNRPEGRWDVPGILETGSGSLPEPTRKTRS